MRIGHSGYMSDPDTPEVPEARVVRQGGVPVTAPMRALVVAAATPAVRRVVVVVGYMVALWPLTATVMLAMALLWAVGVVSSP
jgi:hypothetical protein